MNGLSRTLFAFCREAETLQQGANRTDPFRQWFHLMPPVGAMYPVSGFCRFDGAYHLFYQYSPFNVFDGLRLWGHYRSHDLLHWEQLPPAVYPDTRLDLHGAGRGSVWVEHGKLRLCYTGRVRLQTGDPAAPDQTITSLLAAESADGTHFLVKDCVLCAPDGGGRYEQTVHDPKIWKENGCYYLLLCACRTDQQQELVLLKGSEWGRFSPCFRASLPTGAGDWWEAPERLCLGDQAFWSLSVRHTGENRFACGYQKEALDGSLHAWDAGFDFYAPQTGTDESGRTLLWGWMGTPEDTPFCKNQPTVDCGWQYGVALPRELVLQGDVLLQRPARELFTLRQERQTFCIEESRFLSLPRHADLEFTEIRGAFHVTLFGGYRLSYDPLAKIFTVCFTNRALGCGRTAKQMPLSHLQTLSVFVDSSSVECFVNGGEAVCTTRIYPTTPDLPVEIGGSCKLAAYAMGRYAIEAFPCDELPHPPATDPWGEPAENAAM